MDRWPIRLVVAGAVIAILLSSVLVPRLKARDPHEPDILLQVLGGTADFAAEQAYREADTYFHAGFKCECPDRASHSHEECVERHPSAHLPLLNVIARLHGETAPKVHRHLEGEEEKEILPWFMAAVRLNPRHIDAWRAGSYWFHRTGDPERAEEFISEGIRRNPNDYRLYLDRGILHYRVRNWGKAVADLQHAWLLWRNNSEDAPCERRAIRTYLRDSLRHLDQ